MNVDVASVRRTSWTASDLLSADLPEARFAVEGLFPEGLTFLCGSPKIGKSWLGLGLGIAVASGGYALGTVRVEAGDVLYLALEDNPRRLQRRLRTLLRDDDAPRALHLATEWPRLDESGVEQLAAWLDEHPGARLVVVDVYSRVRPATGNRDRYQADYEAAALLQSVAVEHGVAALALFHTRKAEADDFVETVSGTFGTAAAADTIAVVKRARNQADATLHVTGRDIEERELALKFAPAAGTWVVLGDAAEYALSQTRKVVLDAVRTHGALTPKQLTGVTDVGHELAKKTMTRMAKDGQLVTKSGSYHAPENLPDAPVPAVPESPTRDERKAGTERARDERDTRDARDRGKEREAQARDAGTAGTGVHSAAEDWHCPRCGKPPLHVTAGIAYCSCGVQETIGEASTISLLEEFREESL